LVHIIARKDIVNMIISDRSVIVLNFRLSIGLNQKTGL
jgi:hypothetical protein